MRWKQASKKKSHERARKDGSVNGTWEESDTSKNINEEAPSSQANPRGEPSSMVPHGLGGGQRETVRLSKRSRETVDGDLKW